MDQTIYFFLYVNLSQKNVEISKWTSSDQLEVKKGKKYTCLLWQLPLKLWLVGRNCGGAIVFAVVVVWCGGIIMEEQQSKLAIILLHDILTIKIIMCAEEVPYKEDKKMCRRLL